MLQVPRIRRHDALEVGQPGPPERERAAAFDNDVGDPFVDVLAEGGDEGRKHPEEWEGREAVAAALAEGMDGDEDGDGEDELDGVDGFREEDPLVEGSHGGCREEGG